MEIRGIGGLGASLRVGVVLTWTMVFFSHIAKECTWVTPVSQGLEQCSGGLMPHAEVRSSFYGNREAVSAPDL